MTFDLCIPPPLRCSYRYIYIHLSLSLYLALHFSTSISPLSLSVSLCIYLYSLCLSASISTLFLSASIATLSLSVCLNLHLSLLSLCLSASISTLSASISTLSVSASISTLSLSASVSTSSFYHPSSLSQVRSSYLICTLALLPSSLDHVIPFLLSADLHCLHAHLKILLKCVGHSICDIFSPCFKSSLALSTPRSIVGRRFFFIIGTLYLYRCVTMYITTLPVPGMHFRCAPKVNGRLSLVPRRAPVL